MSEFDPAPRNIETDSAWNREPGLVPIPGSNAAAEYAKFEGFPSKWTVGGLPPGNPYVYRPFPKMVYRAERSELTGGVIACMAAQPDPLLFKDPRELGRAEEAAYRFTARCQRIVYNEEEYRRALSDGWAEGPDEAIKRQEEREQARFLETAHRTHDDRNMGDLAKREVAQHIAEAGGEHVPVIPESRRGRRKRA